jgi:hypothetical protein
MTSLHDDNAGDYVLVPKGKAKLSRARKLVIGIMAVGAVAAIANAGTFASFSASTTNDATFQTQKLIMGNSANGGAECLSAVASDVIDNSTKTNDGSCSTLLFTSVLPGDATQTATVQILNHGDAAHDVALWNAGNCQDTDAAQAGFAKGDSGLCSDARVYIKSSASPTCVFPVGADCSGTPDLTAAGATYSIASLQTAATSFANRITAATAVATGNTGVTFTIGVFLPHHSTCGAGAFTKDAAGASAGAAGFYNSSGVSCDNHYLNKKADLKLKWYMSA